MPSRNRFPLLAGLVGLLLVCSLALPADEPPADLKDKVDLLVKQLDDADAARQTAAETALIQLGTDVLPLLPGADAKLTATQRKHVEAVRGALRTAQAQKDLGPRTVTLHDRGGDLDAVLADLAKQTGIKVADRRMSRDNNPKLKLDLDKVTFWQALDAIAREADATISPYEKDRTLALRDGPYRAVPVSYSGLFRTTARRLTAVRDLEAESSHFCTVDLDTTWEPRFEPLFLESQPESIVVQDDKGVSLNVLDKASGRFAITGRHVSLSVRFEAPARSVARLGVIRGSFNVLGPSKMLTYTFDLPRADGKKRPKITKQGVTVTLREFSSDQMLWTVGVALDYPADGPDFESFESWLVNNQMYLVKDGKRFPPTGGYEIDSQTGHRAVLKYHFVEDEDKGLVLSKPEGWKVEYQTPGAIVKVPVPFEFKDLPLP